MYLLFDNKKQEEKLQHCYSIFHQGRYITVSQYKDVTEERAISRLCGYALCNNRITQVRFSKIKK